MGQGQSYRLRVAFVVEIDELVLRHSCSEIETGYGVAVDLYSSRDSEYSMPAGLGL